MKLSPVYFASTSGGLMLYICVRSKSRQCVLPSIYILNSPQFLRYQLRFVFLDAFLSLSPMGPWCWIFSPLDSLNEMFHNQPGLK